MTQSLLPSVCCPPHLATCGSRSGRWHIATAPAVPRLPIDLTPSPPPHSSTCPSTDLQVSSSSGLNTALTNYAHCQGRTGFTIYLTAAGTYTLDATYNLSISLQATASNVFLSPTTSLAGGLYISSGSVTLSGLTFSGFAHTAALTIKDSAVVTVANSSIKGCVTPTNTTGIVNILNSTASLLFQNVTWAHNRVVNGWGMSPLYIAKSTAVTLVGCTFINNSSPTYSYTSWVFHSNDDDPIGGLVLTTNYAQTWGGAIRAEDSVVLIRQRLVKGPCYYKFLLRVCTCKD